MILTGIPNLKRGPTLAQIRGRRGPLCGHHLFIGFPDRFEIQKYSSEGSLLRVIRKPVEPVEVTGADINRLTELRLREVEGNEARHAVRRAFADLRHADVMPAFGAPVWPGLRDGGPAMIADDKGTDGGLARRDWFMSA